MQPKPEQTPIPVMEVGTKNPIGYCDELGNFIFHIKHVDCNLDKEHDLPIDKEYDRDHKMPKSRIDEDARKKSYCRFCGNYSYDDSVGNCAACGGPREERSRAEFTGIHFADVDTTPLNPDTFCSTSCDDEEMESST
jgi:ribosomal protein L37E